MSDSWRQHVKVNPGGLMRCCLASLNDHINHVQEQPKNFELFVCPHCTNRMIYKNGAWEWAGARA